MRAVSFPFTTFLSASYIAHARSFSKMPPGVKRADSRVMPASDFMGNMIIRPRRIAGAGLILQLFAARQFIFEFF
jgi:hypothetical protein